MENHDLIDQNTNFTGLNSQVQNYLKETANWAAFLSVLAFSGLAVMVASSLILGTLLSSIPEAEGLPFGKAGRIGLSVSYILISLLFFFPYYFQFKFAMKIKTSIRKGSQSDLVEGFKHLKSTYKFWGILMIVWMVLYLLIFIVGMIGLGLGLSSLAQ